MSVLWRSCNSNLGVGTIKIKLIYSQTCRGVGRPAEDDSSVVRVLLTPGFSLQSDAIHYLSTPVPTTTPRQEWKGWSVRMLQSNFPEYCSSKPSRSPSGRINRTSGTSTVLSLSDCAQCCQTPTRQIYRTFTTTNLFLFANFPAPFYPLDVKWPLLGFLRWNMTSLTCSMRENTESGEGSTSLQLPNTRLAHVPVTRPLIGLKYPITPDQSTNRSSSLISRLFMCTECCK